MRFGVVMLASAATFYLVGFQFTGTGLLFPRVAFAQESATDGSRSDPKTKEKPTGTPSVPDKQAGDADGALPAKPTGEPGPNPFPKRSKAPSLDGGTAWLNTSGEITLKDLRGKVVLMDFWTYCCINCLHVLPDLKYLEKKYANELVVIGVHSAKFDNEKVTEHIRRAALRHEIEHPIINDSEMIVWRKFGARSWPTLVVLDPEGFYCGFVPGEGNRELLDEVVHKLIVHHRLKGTLDETPYRFDLERDKRKPTSLRFPGKILADPAGKRLFVSDSGHNRIVVASIDGRLLDLIGNGSIGADDGNYDEAAFDHPQGMALVGDLLYVADTENHLIRTVDLKARRVATLAGTGVQSRVRGEGGPLRETPLNSPWDLVEVDGTLFIAMAGPHQIWHHRIGSRRLGVYAGTGREDILNGPLGMAALAQPSALATDGKFLYVADSEGSAIRRVSLDRDGLVATVVGPSDLPRGRSLFEFGDRDGKGAEARLQHPLGLTFANDSLYAADSYNHKIKRIILRKDEGESETFLGDGTAGDQLRPPRFYEPGGISHAAGTLYVADTNNHRICTIDLNSETVLVLTISGLEPPSPLEFSDREPDSGVPDSDSGLPSTVRPFVIKPIEVERKIVASGGSLRFEIALAIPEGYKLNKQTPIFYKLTARDGQELISAEYLEGRRKAKATTSGAVVIIPIANNAGTAEIVLSLTYGFCRDGVGGLCKLKTTRWLVPLEVAANATENVIQLSAADPP
jgi:thiol-disulfide isomerase/thioredoxin